MTIVRWGLLSTAHINRRVIPAIRSSRRGDLVAVASRDKERATSYALEWQIPKAFGSYESMLSSGEIDAVYISLPNHLHAQWSIRDGFLPIRWHTKGNSSTSKRVISGRN